MAQVRLETKKESAEVEIPYTPEDISFFKQEAESGDPDAQVNYAFAFLEGNGLPKDKNAAIEWFRKAAEQKDVIAQSSLGHLLYRSDGEQKESQQKEGLKWLTELANLPLPEPTAEHAANIKKAISSCAINVGRTLSES